MMEGGLLVSVVTVSFNSLEGLRRTDLSLVPGRDRGWETIVVDGASTDGTPEYLSSSEHGTRRWLSEPDHGIYDAMNKGIALARGRFLLFLNCGDRLSSDLPWERLQSALESESPRVWIGDLRIDQGGLSTTTPESFQVSQLIRLSLPHQAAFIPKEFFDQVGVYDPQYRITADQEWFQRALARGLPFGALGFVVSDYEGGGVSESLANAKAIRAEKRASSRTHLGTLRFVLELTKLLIGDLRDRAKDTLKLWLRRT